MYKILTVKAGITEDQATFKLAVRLFDHQRLELFAVKPIAT